jgi:endonuclease YncB( thermonuclease family)
MSARDQMRALIRAEIDRQRPVEGARRTLELLVEASARPSEEAPGYRVVDREGRPRHHGADGGGGPVTLAELVGELRRQHPGMFRPDPPTAPPPAPVPAGAAAKPPTEPPPMPPAAPPVAAPPTPAAPAAVPPPRAEPGPGLTPGLARPQRVASRGLGRRPLYAAGILAGLAATYLVTRPAPEAPPAPAPAPQAARAPEPALRRDPPATGAVAPEAAPPAPPAPPRALAGVAEVVDTATLKLGGRVVRLFGVEWAKGGQAQDLTGYLAGRPVNCQPAAGDSYQCAVDGHDLSEVVLYNGGGRASADATPDLMEAERRARTEKVGIWRK